MRFRVEGQGVSPVAWVAMAMDFEVWEGQPWGSCILRDVCRRLSGSDATKPFQLFGTFCRFNEYLLHPLTFLPPSELSKPHDFPADPNMCQPAVLRRMFDRRCPGY